MTGLTAAAGKEYPWVTGTSDTLRTLSEHTLAVWDSEFGIAQ